MPQNGELSQSTVSVGANDDEQHSSDHYEERHIFPIYLGQHQNFDKIKTSLTLFALGDE